MISSSTVVAFHGWGGSGAWLKEDCGDLPWIDHYFEGHDVDEACKFCEQFASLVLIGYSLGGQVAGSVAMRLQDRMRAILLYESKPLPKDIKTVPGDYPAIIIWNKRGKVDHPAATRTDSQWVHSQHPVTYWFGEGRHLKVVRGRTPPVGHGWDCNMNRTIERAIRKAVNDYVYRNFA